MASPSRRARIMLEIIQTEPTYINMLTSATTLAPAYRPLLSHAEFSTLFSRFEPILALHRAFEEDLQQLTNWDETTSSIGTLFLAHLPLFYGPYTEFAINYKPAHDVLDKLRSLSRFAKVNDVLKAEHGTTVNSVAVADLLPSCLVTPLSRLPRYGLLLSEALKHTPVDHLDHGPLTAASRALSELTAHINRAVKFEESRRIVTQLCTQLNLDSNLVCQPDRYFILDGVLFKHTPRSTSNLSIATMLQQLNPQTISMQPQFGSFPDCIPPPPPTSSSNDTDTDPSSQTSTTTVTATAVSTTSLFPATQLLSPDERSQPYHFFLFSDFLVYSTSAHSQSYSNNPKQSNPKLATHHVVPFDHLTRVYDPNPDQPSFLLARNHNRMSLKLTAPTLALKQQWYQTISALLLHVRPSIAPSDPAPPQNVEGEETPTTTTIITVATTTTADTNALEVMLSSPLALPASESAFCACCNRGFSLTVHRHACKYCCEIVCSGCSKNYRNVLDTFDAGGNCKQTTPDAWNQHMANKGEEDVAKEEAKYNLRICDNCRY